MSCRLPALQLAMKEWNGPVAITIYIEYKAATAEAVRCTQQVTEYLNQGIKHIWSSGAAPAVSVSFMYTAFRLGRASCNVPATEPTEVQGGHTRATSEFVAKAATSAEYGKTRIPNYILRRFSHSLLSTELPTVTVPGGGPSVSPAWHFHPRTLHHDIPVGARSWQEEYAEFYPVNALRNLAWSQVIIPICALR